MEARVEPPDAVHHRPVVEPDDADRQERGDVRHVRRPTRQEGRDQTAIRDVLEWRKLQIQDQQRDRDCHDAVAERLDASGRRETGLDLLSAPRRDDTQWSCRGTRARARRRPLLAGARRDRRERHDDRALGFLGLADRRDGLDQCLRRVRAPNRDGDGQVHGCRSGKLRINDGRARTDTNVGHGRCGDPLEACDGEPAYGNANFDRVHQPGRRTAAVPMTQCAGEPPQRRSEGPTTALKGRPCYRASVEATLVEHRSTAGRTRRPPLPLEAVWLGRIDYRDGVGAPEAARRRSAPPGRSATGSSSSSIRRS